MGPWKQLWRVMNEEELRIYWLAYTEAWKLIKNWRLVKDEHIVSMVKKHNIGVMNRLFCLVVCQEVKRIRSTSIPLPESDYQRAFNESWKIFKKYSNPNDTDEFWMGLVDDINKLGKAYDQSQFIRNLLVHVTLEEIERIDRSKNAG